MATVWEILIGAAVAVLAIWAVLILVMLRLGRRYGRPSLGELLRLLPDTVRLLTRLARDRRVPRPARVRLWLLLAYLASPIDLIPDIIPVIGYADDAIIVAVALRSVARHAGVDTLARHWPGTPAGLATVLAAARIATEDDDAPDRPTH